MRPGVERSCNQWCGQAGELSVCKSKLCFDPGSPRLKFSGGILLVVASGTQAKIESKIESMKYPGQG
jgi:hypothetical protein